MWKVVLAAAATAAAANLCDSCNGNGVCSTATRRCSCFAGYTGPRCEYVACPTGNAWWDFASAVDTAHAPATCSNMGLCSSTTGVCTCNAGFTGAACEFMACPACQSGHCISMRDAAAANDGINFFTSTSYSLWDADKIFGCQCSYGYTGYDCSQRTCPAGDDPLTTTGQSPEVQLLNCLCNGCTGYFALYYQGFLTANIAPSATVTQLADALLALTSIHGITVTFSSGTTVCSPTGTTASITFTKNGGNLPLIQIRSVLSGTNVITLGSKGEVGTYGGTSAAGTTEGLPCSGRGDCNPATGICTCVPGFSSSDGAGNAGKLGDCGSNTAVPSCPMVLGKICNNQGSCDATTQYRCACNPPYTGAYCTNLLCPTGAAWFDGASATNTAHAVAPCSNRGICNPSTGTCTCQAGFTGAACDLLACPGSPACSGQGSCKTMQQLAALSSSNGVLIGATYGTIPNYAPTWDYNKIQGCYCQKNFYMGPYVGAVNDFQAYDCSARSCAFGDDPYLSGTVDEQQQISCTADGGTFTLSFRQLTTSAISAMAPVATVQTALQALASVVSATVTFGGGATTVCSATGVVTTVRFTYAQGNLPPLIASVSGLTLSTGTPTITVTETVPGTKANLECSGRGVCDRTLGRCNCYDYFLSSDGYGNVGTRGDCGYLTPYSTLSTTITTITTTTTTTSTM